MTRLFCCCSIAALLAATSVSAGESAPAPVDEVIVTATRLPGILADTPGARVITEDEIEARGAVFATDLLETLPGLNITRNGLGGVAYVRQRGLTNDKSLVLVDGVPTNDPSQPSGGFDFSAFEVADIERLEVLSGPQGSLWGSDAIAGVISFTTRELDGVRADVEAGSHNTVRGSVAAGRREDAYAIGLNLSGLTTDGVSKAANGTEDDGFDTLTVGANGRYAVSPRISVDARIRYNESKAGIDGYDANFAFGDTDETYETETLSGFVRAKAQGYAGFDHALSVSLLETERNGRGGQFPYGYDAERQVYRYTAERARAEDIYGLAFGVEREDTTAALSDGTEADLGATAAFAVLRLTPSERLAVTGSARYDDPDEYGSETTFRAAASYELGSGFAARAAYGQGFKTPSISQTACDFCFPVGPADLKPERAEGWDAGLAWASPDGRVDAALTAFRIEVEDEIVFVSGPGFSTRYANVAKTRSQGLEAEATAQLGRGVTLRGAYAYTDAENRTTGERLLRAPQHQGSAVVSYQGDRWDGAFTVRAESDQSDSDPSSFAPADREGFVTADLAAAYAFAEGLQLTARVDNLFDEEFQQVLGYAEPGRSVFVGVRVRR